MESYKHKFAKNVLADWLRTDLLDVVREFTPPDTDPESFDPQVWLEYPVCLTKSNKLVGIDIPWNFLNDDFSVSAEIGLDQPEPKFQSAPPSYDECIAMGTLPVCIFDISVQIGFTVAAAFEVVFTSAISTAKQQYLGRIRSEARFALPVFSIDADWILSRCGPPSIEEINAVARYS